MWPFDRARTRLLNWLTPLSGYLAGSRELRVAVLGVLLIGLSFALAVGSPLWLLALGPILLGVPHLVADIRYCFVRPGYHRRLALWVAAGVPMIAGAILNEPAISLAAVAGAAAAARGASSWRWLIVGAAAVGAAGSLLAPATAVLVLVHGHNFVAVALWWAWRPRRSKVHLLPLSLFVLLSVGIVVGLFDGLVGGLIASAPTQLDLQYHLAHLAPGLAPELGARVVLSFAFAQSVHYVMWLRLVPEEDRDRVSPRTFRASYRALQQEMGRGLLALAVLFALGLGVWAVIDLANARASYLRFAGFHVTLELLAATLFLLEGRRVLESRRAAPGSAGGR